MIEIEVIVKDEKTVSATAKLIGWNEKSVRHQLKLAQKDGRICIFPARVTKKQFDEILRHEAKN